MPPCGASYDAGVMCGSGLDMSCSPTRPERKKRALRRRLKHLGPRSVVLCEDETDLLVFPPLRAGWAKRGQPAQVALSGSNARRVVFGTLNVRTGHRLFLVRARQRGEDFRVFLQTLHHHYRGRHVVLVLDGDSAHTAAASQCLAAQLGIELLWLPTRCPELNPWEALWRSGKQTISANRQYPTIDEVVERFLVYLYWLSPQEARRKAGLLSKHCWLNPHV
jgi:transposase